MKGRIWRTIGYVICVVIMAAAIGNHYNYMTSITTNTPGWKYGPEYVQQHLYFTLLYVLASAFCMFMIAYTSKRSQK